QDMLQNLKKGVPYPLHFPSLDEEIAKMNGSAEGAHGDDAGFTPEMNTPASDFDAPFVDSGGGDFEPPPLDDDSGGFDLDSVSVAAPESASTLYFDALNQFSAGNFNDAIAAFQKIQDLKKVSREDVQYLEKSMFDMGRAWLKMRNAKKSLEVFSNFLKKYPNSELNRKAMMQMGEIYEAMKDMQRAAAFYSKVAKMQPEDKDSISAANKLKGMVKR
ncbi:MAG: tetratricopeptide repeat protein, partial [Leptospiraceae bacterium]|nr:tetratricopeptide repeat protein [Leptospiraceae bacterium]